MRVFWAPRQIKHIRLIIVTVRINKLHYLSLLFLGAAIHCNITTHDQYENEADWVSLPGISCNFLHPRCQRSLSPFKGRKHDAFPARKGTKKKNLAIRPDEAELLDLKHFISGIDSQLIA